MNRTFKPTNSYRIVFPAWGIFLTAVFEFFFSSSSVEAREPFAGLARKDYKQREVLVKFRDGLSSQTRDRTLVRHAGLRLNDLDQNGLSHVMLLDDQSVDEAVRSLQNNANVEYAQPNFIYKISAYPNDPNYDLEWAMKNVGQTITTVGQTSPTVSTVTSGDDIGIEPAWDYITDCSSVPTAVLDTGVNYNHIDLAGNMWNGGTAYPKHGFNFEDGSNDPMDKNGHGTHVAGIIGAVGNNGLGIAGICWKANIMAIKVLDATGSGSTSTITQGLNFAVQNGAKVINLSLGGNTYDAAFSGAISNAAAHGALVVVAAGNTPAGGLNNDSGYTPTYPCNYNQTNMLCVAALKSDFNMAGFSNFGAQSVHIAAPGLNIVSTVNGTTGSLSDPLTTGWTLNSTTLFGYTSTGWGYTSQQFNADGTWASSGAPSYATLSNPIGYNNSTPYANGTDDRIYKTFNIPSSNSVAILSFQAIIDTEQGHDNFYAAYRPTTGDPFASGTLIDALTGSTTGYREAFEYDISPCIGSQCSIGFRLQTDTGGTAFGVAVSGFTINTITLNTTAYGLLDGTSMATPIVAGVAAMLMAYNPDYTYTDVITAIKSGGSQISSLSRKTTTGKVINAMGALSYINTPTGLTATPQ